MRAASARLQHGDAVVSSSWLGAICYLRSVKSNKTSELWWAARRKVTVEEKKNPACSGPLLLLLEAFTVPTDIDRAVEPGWVLF